MICPQEERLLDIGKIPLTVSEVFSCKWFQSHSSQLEALLMSGERPSVFQDSSSASASSHPRPPPLMPQDPPQAVQVLHHLSPSSASQQPVIFSGTGGSKAVSLPAAVSAAVVDGGEQGWGGSAPFLLPGGSFPSQGALKPLLGQRSCAACPLSG